MFAAGRRDPTAVMEAIDALFELTRALAATQRESENFFFSPASMQAALCAAVHAATPRSEAEKHLLLAFGRSAATTDDAYTATRASGMIPSSTSSTASSTPALTVANALFEILHGESDFSEVRPEFAALLQSRMGAQVLPARRAAEINAWCAEQTQNLIEKLLEDGDVGEDTLMVLVNAVLFRGTWCFPFKLEDTCEDTWDEGGPSCARAMFMHKRFTKYDEQLYAGIVGERAGALARAVCVPYTESGIQAWFILPEERGPAALARVGDALPQLWREITQLRARGEREVHLTCPRFDVDTGVMDVIPALQALGITAPFHASAESPRLLAATARRDAYIGKVTQRVVCKVDEKGTVAAACSGVVAFLASCRIDDVKPEPFVVELVRPFWMLIVRATEESMRVNVPLFIGRITKP
jgi:serine protease inhibitor